MIPDGFRDSGLVAPDPARAAADQAVGASCPGRKPTDATLIDPAAAFGAVLAADLDAELAERVAWRNAADLLGLDVFSPVLLIWSCGGCDVPRSGRTDSGDLRAESDDASALPAVRRASAVHVKADRGGTGPGVDAYEIAELVD
ncbi:hypothetical protein [Micromonospora sp. NPDC050200]|uniref:hypothetical protein n=1 Tax=Micromonospora sp. NPDC050200 TaxID=3155664 RepID=UPI0033D22679